jgi:hypothetical protein
MTTSRKLLMVSICLLSIFSLSMSLEYYKKKTSLSTPSPDITNTTNLSWQKLNSPKEQDTIKSWKPLSIKIIFYHQDQKQKEKFLVSLKRVGWSIKGRKNMLWEFPGGRVDHNENPISSLRRELFEEDSSQKLLTLFDQHLKEKNVFFKNIKVKNQEHHSIVKIKLASTQWNQTTAHFKDLVFKNKETYGFYFVDKDTITKKSLRKTLWTPKSKKILSQLYL